MNIEWIYELNELMNIEWIDDNWMNCMNIERIDEHWMNWWILNLNQYQLKDKCWSRQVRMHILTERWMNE